jgi:MYXO-CTERM domain-containing protein
MRSVPITLVIALLGLSSTARAHFNLISPPPTTNDTIGGKGPPPCGPDTTMAATPTPAQGGHTIVLKVNEFVRHGGFYRVALSINSRSEIPVDNVVYDANNQVLPPTGMPSGTSDHADFENPPVFPVLADNLFPHEQIGPQPMAFQADIMLPNVNCTRCTLQVIEFMHPHGFNAGGGYFYHHCAELKITADPALPPFMSGSDAGASGSGGAGSGGAAGGGGGSAGSNGGMGGAAGAAGTMVGTGAGGASGSGPQGSAGSSAQSDNTADSNGGCSCSLGRGDGRTGAWCVVGLFVLATRRRRRLCRTNTH